MERIRVIFGSDPLLLSDENDDDERVVLVFFGRRRLWDILVFYSFELLQINFLSKKCHFNHIMSSSILRTWFPGSSWRRRVACSKSSLCSRGKK